MLATHRRHAVRRERGPVPVLIRGFANRRTVRSWSDAGAGTRRAGRAGESAGHPGGKPLLGCLL